MILMLFIMVFLAVILTFLQIAFQWIMAIIIIASIFWIIIEVVIYKILKDKKIFDKEYLQQIRETKYGKYKEIFILLLKNGLKISIMIAITIIIICSVAFYINPFAIDSINENNHTNSTIESSTIKNEYKLGGIKK